MLKSKGSLDVETPVVLVYIYLPDKEKKFTFAMHSHKISTPTGTPLPDEKVKELSSNEYSIDSRFLHIHMLNIKMKIRNTKKCFEVALKMHGWKVL